jgi:putative redox protein
VRQQIPEAAQQLIQEHGEAEVLLAGRPFRIRRGFVEDIAEQPQRDRIAGLQAPLLVLHSPQDELVDFAEAAAIHAAARQPKSLISLDGANHLLTEPADAAWAVRLIAAWSSRYLS